MRSLSPFTRGFELELESVETLMVIDFPLGWGWGDESYSVRFQISQANGFLILNASSKRRKYFQLNDPE